MRVGCARRKMAKPSTESLTLNGRHCLSRTGWFGEERVIRDFGIRFIRGLGPVAQQGRAADRRYGAEALNP